MVQEKNYQFGRNNLLFFSFLIEKGGEPWASGCCGLHINNGLIFALYDGTCRNRGDSAMKPIYREAKMTQVIHVECKRHRDWYMATSRSLPELIVAAETIQQVLDDVPQSIALLFKHNQNMEVTVREVATPDARPISELVYTAIAA